VYEIFIAYRGIIIYAFVVHQTESKMSLRKLTLHHIERNCH